MPDTPARPELVIFDCDGVLVDSERTTTRLLAEVVTEFGRPTTPEQSIAQFKGTDLAVITKRLEDELGRPVPGLADAYRERMYAALAADCPPIEGALAVLDAIDDAGIPRCVASNGPLKKIQTTLTASGLMGRIDPDSVFSAYEVGTWKPEPGLFLHAAEAFGVAPGRCVVIEDSVSGVVAALAAGMRVLAFADLTTAGDLSGAGAAEPAGSVFAHMHDLPALLGLAKNHA